MFTQLRHELRTFSAAGPGTRFHERQQRHRVSGAVQRAVMVGFGALFVVAGILMLVFPGPGLVVILLGLALLAGESRRLAIVLDRLDVVGHRVARRIRARWRTWPLPIRIASVLAFLGIGALFTLAFTYLSYQYGGSLLSR